MATRRPSVPKATFTSGLGKDQDPSPGAALAGTTPGPDEAARADAAAAPTNGKRSSKARPERQLASGAAHRSRQEGVVHTAENSPVPARSFSGRLLVLALTMGVVTVLLAPNVHTFMTQRTEIAELREDIAARQVQQDAYASELQRWDDPAYIKQQARDRVSMLMPGETGYWVYGADGTDAVQDSVDAAKTAAAQATSAKKAMEETQEPWVDSLWDAVRKSADVQAPAR